MSKSNDNNFVQYNSLISLSITSEEYENTKYTKCLYAENNLENSLSFKLCQKPLREYYDLMGSYFFIRNIDECVSIFGKSDTNNKKSFKKEENISKELNFINKERIRENNHFYLQHMMSKKFVSIEITPNNLFVLKLLKNIDNAVIFSLKKINEKRNSKDFVSTKEIYYLNLYEKETDQFYYIQDDINPIIKNNNYYNILITKNPFSHFIITNQNLNIKDSKKIYSGQLINIIFSKKKGNREEQYMLSVSKNEQMISNLDIISYDNNTKDEKEDNNDDIIEDNIDYQIIGLQYNNELCDHVLNNSFWVIEEDLENINSLKKEPIKIKEHIRIKNLNTGLYLSIRKKGESNDNNNTNIYNMNSFNLENKKYEFTLVDEQKLNDNLNLEFNFVFFNYILDSLSLEIKDEGKYILKGVFTNLKFSPIIKINSYYQSISLTMFDKNNLCIKNEDDFIFTIKKIDIFQGNEVNYIVKIIQIIDKQIEENKLSDYNIINETIRFFLDYLLNIDYSFRDQNYEYNVPIKERQILLYKFNTVENCTNVIGKYLKKIEEEDNFLTENIKEKLNELLNNIIKFFKVLSYNNEEIKQAIYIIALNKLLKLSEIIFCEDFTILITFIFDLIDDSESLQDYLLGGGGLLKQQIIINSKLSKFDISNLLREATLLKYIETNHNYLLCYEKLIRLNKVQYRRNEIISHVKKHIEEVKNKDNPSVQNYRKIINKLVDEVNYLIKKHAFLLEKFKNKGGESKDHILYDGNRKRRSFKKKNTVKESIIKRNREESLKQRKLKMGSILGTNIFIESSKNLNTKALLENRDSNKNVMINNINNNNENNVQNKITKLLSFSSFNSNNNNNNENNTNNKITLINNETSESSRPLKEINNIEKIKYQFKKNVKSSNIEMKKTFKFFNNNIISPFLKKKPGKYEQVKTTVEESFDNKETLISDKIEPYQNYLNKLGKICIFIQFFSSFDFEKVLFIQDNFLYEIFKNGLKTEDLENPLYIFFISKSQEKNKNWYYDPNSIILYLFNLYNKMFPNIKSKLQAKIKNKRNISGLDIIEEFQNNNVDENYEGIDEINYKQNLKDDFDELDQYLCILYSIYQFCINQYAKTVYKLSIIISNFYLNFMKENDLQKFRICFTRILKNLLSNVAFMKNDILESLYSKAIVAPSLLTNEFDLDFINPTLNERTNKKSKKKKNKKKYTKTETKLIELVIYLEKKCVQIQYLYEKIIIFKYIKNLNNEKYSFEQKEFDNTTEDQLSNIIKIISKQRKKIILHYEKYIKGKINYSLVNNLSAKEDNKNEENKLIEEVGKNEDDNYEAFQIGKKTEIITKLLRQYEIDKFFNNIIYIETNESYMPTDKIITKIRKMRENLYKIEKEIQIIKISYRKDINLNGTDKTEIRSFLFMEESNKKSFINLNRYLSNICNESGKMFNLNNISINGQDKLSKLLSMENNTFYQKIKFCQTFKYMIEALSYYKGEKDENILIYCSYLLKIFIDIKNTGYNFHKTISKYYELYGSLIYKSFKIISKYSIDIIGEKIQYLFLNICFYGIESFLIIIKNSKLPFSDIKDFMENIFSELLKIFEQFINKKFKIIYQILYTYAVSRVLLFLNKQKNYDSSLYDAFFNFIYPINKMRENILYCIETFNNNSNKANIISRSNSNVFLPKESNFNVQDDDAETFCIPNDEKKPLIVQNLKSRILPMDLSNIMNIGEAKTSKDKTTIFKEEENLDDNKNDEDFIWWDNEDEFDRLSFYLNFLSVYVIYLDDKNSLLHENKNEFSTNDNNNNDIKEVFSFNILSSKIKYLLDYSYNYFNNSSYKEDSNNLISTEDTLIKEEKRFFGEELEPKNLNNDYKFHSALLESILNYRTMHRKNIVEVQVKNIKKRENINDYPKTETENQEFSICSNINENKNVIFYYYDPEYIDIILLEKIFNAIELKEDLMSYCIEEYKFEKDIPELLENLMDIKKNYKLIESYVDEEFNLIHNYFINNNMELLIKKILKSYNSNDLIEIEEMDNYLFNKMGEIYSDSSLNMNEESLEKNNSLVNDLKIKQESINPNLNKMDLLTFFDSLVYIYPKFKKSICIIYYKIGFKLLSEKCQEDIDRDETDEDIIHNTNKIDLEPITKKLLLLFSRKRNSELIEDKKVFQTMLNSISLFFSCIILKERGFVFKNIDLLKELLNKLDFIFDRLSKNFEKIVIFMKKPSNLKNINKFNKYKDRLENLLDFLIIFLEFKKVTEENILTEEIDKFIGVVVEKVIKLLFFLIKLPNSKNFEIIDILIKFLFNFIKGPDIKNINLLFSLGFFDLVSFIIKDIDYYQIFLNYLIKDNIYSVIDDISRIECKIIKIFIIYYNVSHGNYNNNIIEFEKLQHWYEENFKYIRQKLKRLYYISEKEMDKKEYDIKTINFIFSPQDNNNKINKMLLFMKSEDENDYTKEELKIRGGLATSNNESDSIFEIVSKKKQKKKSTPQKEIQEKTDNNDNNNKIINCLKFFKMKKKNKEINNNYCIIKFDLILTYYSLYNYHKDLTTKGRENALSKIKKKNDSIFFWIINFFIDLFIFIANIFIFAFYAVFYIFKKISSKSKRDVDLLQDLTDIDAKSQLIDDQKMINSLGTHIRQLQVSIKNIIFKIYFPMIDKANTIEEYKEEYYKVEKIDSSEFINHILSNFDIINIRAKQYVLINNIIKIPVINLIFEKKNVYIYAIILIIFGLLYNLLIILSFSTFVDENCRNLNFPYVANIPRIQCPHLLYRKNEDTNKKDDENLLLQFKVLGIIELFLQFLIFFDYIVRKISVEYAIIKFKYKVKELNNYTFSKIIKIIYRSFINFRSLYYILSIIFIILGIKIHPFFNCITLLEFVNRIQLMQTVLKAMYKPLKNILITLLMFIILEYLFSLFAVSFFTTHFPNKTDTKNFLKTFMRMIDQTFKQDGGIGTYLDKSLDENFIRYSTPSYFNLRFLFDLLFFLLILLLIFQMFLSTIIDYFNETRENTEDFKEGLETQCSVCGMEREKIEKINSNEKNAFDKHIDYYHNAFNYIYYLMYLQSISFRDTIIEKTIWNLHLKKDLSYLPKNVCFKIFEKKCWKKLNQRKNKEEEEE